MSSESLIVSDRYGLVWKKSNDSAAMTAASTPGRPATEPGAERDGQREHEHGDLGLDLAPHRHHRRGDDERREPSQGDDEAGLAPTGRVMTRTVQGEVELEHVDAGFAEEAEGAAVGVVVDQPSTVSTGSAADVRHPRRLERALATEMCGSRPDPEAVTASTGTAASAARPFSAR